MSFIRNAFRSKPIPPPETRIEDVQLPEGEGLRRRLITDAEQRAGRPPEESEEERLGREHVRDILSRREDVQSTREYSDLLQALDVMDRLENQRRAEGQRQRFISEGIGAGAGRDEAIARDLREIEGQRRAERSQLALQMGSELRGRRERAISLASDLAGERQRRNLADVASSLDVLGSTRGYPVVSQPGFAPSIFSQVATGVGQVAGAVTGLRRSRRRPQPQEEPEEQPNYPEQFRAKYPDLSGAFKRRKTRPFQIF